MPNALFAACRFVSAGLLALALLSAPITRAGEGPSASACRSELTRMRGAFRAAWKTAERERGIERSLRSEMLRFVEEYRRNADDERRFLAGEIPSEAFLARLEVMKGTAGVTEIRAGADRREMRFEAELPDAWRPHRQVSVSFCAQEGGTMGCLMLNAGAPAQGSEYWAADVDRQLDRPLAATDLASPRYAYGSEEDYLYGAHSPIAAHCPSSQLPVGTPAHEDAESRESGQSVADTKRFGPEPSDSPDAK